MLYSFYETIDTNQDIELFLQSRIDDLPVPSSTKRQELAKKILSKSAGCFLWVRLVLALGVFENIYGDKTIEKVLEEMPEEMTEFYGRTVEVMSKTVREKDIAKTILKWSVASTRPLKSSELQRALILDMGEKVGSIEKSVEVYVANWYLSRRTEPSKWFTQPQRTFSLGIKIQNLELTSELSMRR